MRMSHDVKVVIQAVDQASSILREVRKNIESNFAGINSSANGLNTALDKTKTSLSSMLGNVGGFVIAQAGIASLSVAVSSASNALIGYNANMEQARIGLETLLGSAGAAEVFLSDLKTMAANTPFEFPQLQDASQKFLAFGFAAKDVLPTLEAVGNAAAGLGKGADGINRAVLAIGQIKAKGRVQAEELLQLAELGIPAYQILAEKLKLTGDQVANIGNEGISAKTAIDALVAGMNERFPEMMKRQSDTMTGMFSTIKDNMSMIFGGLGEGLFNQLQGATATFRNWTTEILGVMQSSGIYGLLHHIFPPEWELRIISIGSTIKRLATIGVDVGGAIVQALAPTAGMLLDLAEYALKVSMNFVDSITPAIKLVAENGDILRGVIVSITTVFLGLEIQAKISSGAMLASITNAIKKIGASLTALYTAHPILLVGAGIAGIISYKYYKHQESLEDEENANATLERMSEKINARRRMDEMEKKRADLEKHKGVSDMSFDGTKGSKKAANELSRLEKETQRIKEKVGNAFDDLATKILEKTGSTYEIGAAKIRAELDKIKREVIDPAIKLGVDTGTLKDKMSQYAKVMRDELDKAVRYATTDIKLEIQTLLADTLGSAYDVAKAKYDAEMEKIMRKYEDMKIKLGVNNIALADKWKAAAVSKAQKEFETAAPTDWKSGWQTGIKSIAAEFNNFGKDVQNIAIATATGMRDAFGDFFFDAMTGQIKSLGEYFTKFFQGIAKTISQLLANALTKKLLGSLFPNLKLFASGGRTLTDTFIAGENGPELVKVNGGGATVTSAHNTASMLKENNSVSVEVNVINQSGQQLSAQQGNTTFDGQKYVVDVWLDAYSRNVNGMRSAIQGR